MFFILAASSSQPLSFLTSLLSRRILNTKIASFSHHSEAYFYTIAPSGGCFRESLRTIGRGYHSGLIEPRSISFQLQRSITTSHFKIHRRLLPYLTNTKIFKFHQVEKMSTRRSARLIAASELEASLSASSTTEPVQPPVTVKKGRKRKAATDAAPDVVAKEEAPAKAAKATATSSRRRAQKKTSTPPLPSAPTPTPSNAKLMAEPAAPGDSLPVTPAKRPRAAAVDRLADSNATLATLLSPETSRIVTKKTRTRSSSASPTKAPMNTKDISAPKAAATGNILDEGNEFLISVDPRMRPLVENNHCRIFSPEGLAEEIDPFEALCSGIISQQVSGAAAKSIKRKFINLFYEGEGEDANVKEEKGSDDDGGEEEKKRRFPHPSQVVGLTLEKLRTAGLSQRKAEYVSGLAEKFVAGELSAQLLADAPYEEVIERLTAVRGLGLWSAEMFACFGLKRIDVFSLGDLGVQRGMAAFVGRDIAKLKTSKGGKFKYMSEADMKALSDQFKPYRSLFMWYMWRVEETDISTME
ncbi:DNA glycosylase [Nemania sp. FL0031]|nr:DNA glycosylase [Nemania sp. FL0031]